MNAIDFVILALDDPNSPCANIPGKIKKIQQRRLRKELEAEMSEGDKVIVRVWRGVLLIQFLYYIIGRCSISINCQVQHCSVVMQFYHLKIYPSALFHFAALLILHLSTMYFFQRILYINFNLI